MYGKLCNGGDVGVEPVPPDPVQLFLEWPFNTREMPTHGLIHILFKSLFLEVHSNVLKSCRQPHDNRQDLTPGTGPHNNGGHLGYTAPRVQRHIQRAV